MANSSVIRLLMFCSVLLTMRNAIGQNTETWRFPGTGDSCNVINLNIGRGDESEEQVRGPQGRPGKRGSIGLTGSKGDKGHKGDVGPRGISPEINMAEVTSAVLKALAATSCEELMEDHGISESGYYQMRTNESDFATYKYCDFEIRHAGSCEELRSTIGDTMRTGYYRLRERNGFILCTNKKLPGDCKTVDPIDVKISLPSGGIFDIYSEPWGREVEVTCDLQTDGGGWTVFQRRMDGSVDFHRNWVDYVNGFGNKNGEFWLGLETIYQLTNDGDYELRVDITDFSGSSAYAKYGTFSISSGDDNYRLLAGDYSGTAGDSLQYHTNDQFSTKDADHDKWVNNCAETFKGGWWFRSCLGTNLNGIYNKRSGNGATGTAWYYWKDNYNYLKSTEMKFRKK